MGEIFLGLGANGERQVLQLSRANRHGLVAGATGTGKTVTLQGLAESFSAEGVPVFLADVKEVQEGVLNIVFRYADEQGLLLLDLEDLQAMLVHTAENAAELTTKYGNVSKATVGTIQRQLLSLDSQG